MPRGKGRPSKITPELTERVCELIEKGLPYTLVCEAVGINESTFYDWIKKGEIGKKGYTDFSERVSKSKANYALICLERVNKYADNGSAFCATWLLERRFPNEFGRRESIDIKSKNRNESVNINADVKLKNHAEFEQAILNKLARIRERSDRSGPPKELNP